MIRSRLLIGPFSNSIIVMRSAAVLINNSVVNQGRVSVVEKVAGSKSRNKGKSGERELASIYKSVFGGSFQRVPGSGGFTGGKNAVRRETLSDTQIKARSGDIHTPDFLPRLTLEVKFYADFPYHLLLTPKPVPLLDRWIAQTREGAGADDLWLLNWKVNRKAWNVVCPATHNFAVANHCIYISGSGETYIVADLLSFLAANKDAILRLAGDVECASRVACLG